MMIQPEDYAGDVQRAIDVAAALSKPVTLAGHYTAGSLMLSSGITLAGVGRDACSITLKSGTNDSLLKATDKTNLTVSNIKLAGNSANQSSGSLVSLDGCTNSTITGCWIDDAKDTGVYLKNASTGNRITGNRITNVAGYNGISIGAMDDAGPTGNMVDHNEFIDCNQNGVYCYASGNIITDNAVTGSVVTGIKVLGGDNCEVSRNVSSANGAQGVHFDASEGVTAEGNTCNGNGHNGIFIDDANGPCTSLVIAGNTCNTNTQRGIYVRGADGLAITGNITEENVMDGIVTVDCTNVVIT